jgi:hypothetical protein
VGFAVDIVTARQVYPRILIFSPASSIPRRGSSPKLGFRAPAAAAVVVVVVAAVAAVVVAGRRGGGRRRRRWYRFTNGPESLLHLWQTLRTILATVAQ